LRKAGPRSGQNQPRSSHQNIPTEAARNEPWFVPPIVVPILIAISVARYVFFALSEDSTMDDPGEELLARNMVDVHGAEAATIVRANARGAAVAGQPVQAKSWIRVLGIIQRSQALKSSARLRP
jgi:hypothetical protein